MTLSAFPWWLPLLLAVMSIGKLPADPPGTKPAVEPVRYAILVTGSELLTGVYPDGHTHFLTRTLRPLGLACVASMSVDDKPGDIQAALRFAVEKADLVIVTGGLGPTDDDITRETLASFTGIELAEQPEVVQQMERRFRLPREQIRANLLQQAQVPIRGEYLKNPQGTAVGLVFDYEKAVIVALPGPPSELRPMVCDELVPLLSRRFGTRLPGSSLTLRFVGLGQSQVDQTLEQHVPLPDDVTLTSQFADGRVDFTFSLPDDNPQNQARLQDIKQKIVEHLGDYVYADNHTTLEDHVLRLLAAKNSRLALAEAGSGGSLAAALTKADAADRGLAGAYVAASELQLGKLLRVAEPEWSAAKPGAERAEMLAAAVAALTGSEWIVAVGDVQRSDDGTDSIPVVIRSPQGGVEHDHLQIRSGGTGGIDHLRLTTQLLDMLRRKLK